MPDNITGIYITELRADPALVAALNTILPLINTNKTTLGMTAQQVTDLTNLCNAYITQYNAANTARLAAKAAVASKDANKKTALTSLYSYVKTWRANAAIPDSLLEQLMVAPHNVSGTTTPPVTPLDLVAFSDGQGNIELRWKKSTNKSGTQFVIEQRTSPTEDWTLAGVTTKQKYELTRTPGEYVAFRIIAVRGGMTSNPSIPVSLWDNGSGQTLQIAA